jgi:hypothetical protein
MSLKDSYKRLVLSSIPILFSFTFKIMSSKGLKTNPNWLELDTRGKAIAQRDACSNTVSKEWIEH